MKNLLIIILINIAISVSVFAQDSGYFGGVSIGKSEFDASKKVEGLFSADESSISSGVFLGYKLNKYFGLETSYNDLVQGTDNPVLKVIENIMDEKDVFSYKVKTFNFTVISQAPLHDYFKPYLKLGTHRYKSEVTRKGKALKKSFSQVGLDIHYGMGIETKIYKNVSAKIEYIKYKFDKSPNVESTNFLLVYNF